MIKKDKYMVVPNNEWELIVSLLQSHPSFRALQEGSAINNVFAAIAKAEQDKLAAEQQPVQQEPDTEPVYAHGGRNIQPGQAPIAPPRRGVAAKVSQTQPPAPPQPPIQKKKPQFVTRQAPKEETEEESQEQEEESDEGNEVEADSLMEEFSDEDF